MKELSDKNKPQKLEDLFRMGLEEAEVTPSDRVWERIEQGLDSKDAGYYKERLGWYRSLAAACILLVMCAAGYLYYDINNSHSGHNPIAQPATAPVSPPSNVNPGTLVPDETSNPAVAQQQPTWEQENGLPAPEITQTDTNQKNRKTLPAVNNQTYAAQTNPLKNAAAPNNKPRVNSPSEEKALAVNQDHKSESGETIGNDLFLANTSTSPQLEPLESVSTGLPTGISRAAVIGEMQPKVLVTDAAPKALALLAEPAAEQTEKKQRGHWNFSAKYAPQYFNQNIQLVAQNNALAANAPNSSNNLQFSAPNASSLATPSYAQALSEYDNTASAGFSYNTALAAGYTFNEHWSLESGLNFTQNVANSSTSFIFNNPNLAARYYSGWTSANLNDTKQSNDPIAVLPATALVASLTGPQNFNTATVVQTPTFETQYRYRLIGVPVRLNYQTSQRKSFYFASVGFLTNMLVQAQVLSNSAKVPDIKYQGQAESPFRTWQVAATVSAGKGFRISKAINVRAGLEGTQNLNSLAARPEFLTNGKGKPYTIGVAFSSSYTLGL